MLVTFSVESKEARTRTSPWHTFFFSESVCRRYFRRSRTRWQSRITQNVHNHHSIYITLLTLGNKVRAYDGLCKPAILHIFHPIVASLIRRQGIQFSSEFVGWILTREGVYVPTVRVRLVRPCPASRRAILRKFDAFLFLSFLEGRVSLKIHFERKTLMCCSKKSQNIPCSCFIGKLGKLVMLYQHFTRKLRRGIDFSAAFSKWWQATPPAAILSSRELSDDIIWIRIGSLFSGSYIFE